MRRHPRRPKLGTMLGGSIGTALPPASRVYRTDRGRGGAPTPTAKGPRERPDEARLPSARRRGEMTDAPAEVTVHELVTLIGQTAGPVRDVSPAAEVVGRMVASAERELGAGETAGWAGGARSEVVAMGVGRWRGWDQG